GLEGKFSLEYGIAATLLDGHPNLESFTDAAVQRPKARRLMERIHTTTTADAGDGLLAGEIKIEVTLRSGEVLTTRLATPPGAPARPPTDEELQQKAGTRRWTWSQAKTELDRCL